MSFVDKDLLSIQEARILMENARDARNTMLTFPQERLDLIVDALAASAKEMAEELAVMSADETGYGRFQDKYVKNRFVCDYLPERLKSMSCVGFLNENTELKTIDVGVPVGVLVALTPSVSPVSTALYNVLMAVKSGNPIVIAPHERAGKVTGKLLDRLLEAGKCYGLPDGAIGYLKTVTRAGALELCHHPATAMIVNTGVPELNREASRSGKPYIYGGTGNGPVFIERTADVGQAVEDIIASRTFDYGIVSAAEQYMVVDSLIAAEVKSEMLRNGAYFMNEEEEKQLIDLLTLTSGKTDTEIMGRPAEELAKRAGFTVPKTTTVLVSEQKYISDRNPFAKELLCPVLAYYIEDDWMHACEKCMCLLVNESHGHTLVIHSRDEEVIRQFALKKPVGRVLVNTPATLGSMGATTNLFPAMTLGSITAGAGITADNVSPMNFIYIRKVGYGVRGVEEFLGPFEKTSSGYEKAPETIRNHALEKNKGMEDARDFLKQILQALSKELD
ncbi:MAG TPA: acetaldehyde dehydrogenase [Lachnoclostridium phytofermentans]|uniref:Acetaldehyde dehydrogenase n=1 Tax=Lachnoclostridium phytofermentans TaxID=66219 RepID=A0A3D2X626_9FIRM|nr:aldehyde dehydrogenase family protein [Lachnoclostridium sp.]HCL02591.1 acetaldehyde dehydrogenase [Lachnoclostridium phytofermentans]